MGVLDGWMFTHQFVPLDQVLGENTIWVTFDGKLYVGRLEESHIDRFHDAKIFSVLPAMSRGFLTEISEISEPF